MEPLRRQSKSIPVVYGSVAVFLLAVIAALAVVLVPPSPPEIAEFAPSAERQIEDAPAEQATRFGSGAGSCGGGQICDGSEESARAAAAARPKIERARVRRCVGDPPRQTEDPQSPPCVNFWEGDNGGATAKGVTRDEIRVAARVVGHSGGDAYWETLQTLATHFNSRYEFYGRRIRLIRINGGYPSSPQQARAEALKDATEIDAFASLAPSGTFARSDSIHQYRAELARLGVMSVFGVHSITSTGEALRAASPFAWDYYAPTDETEKNLAEFACNALAGRPAKYAGPEFQRSERSFAVLWPSDRQPPIDPLRRGLAACGQGLHATAIPSNPRDPGRAAVIADLKLREITTVFLLVPAQYFTGMSEASSQGYQPEWIIPGQEQEYDFWWQSVPPDQREHLFGLVPWNKAHPPGDEPTYWAVREGDPSAPAFRPGADGGAATIYSIDDYHGLLVLASGIQMAGPRLSAQAFARGLQATKFPNPDAGRPPWYQAEVGVGISDRWMTRDHALVWWSDRAPTYRSGGGLTLPSGEAGGGFCWAHKGMRWSAGRWPNSEPPLFDPDPRNCR